MTPEERARLRELAEKATPGPWLRTRIKRADGMEPPDHHMVRIGFYEPVMDERDANFIAAANPAVVLTLLDALDQAEEDARRIASSIVQRVGGSTPYDLDGVRVYANASYHMINRQDRELVARYLGGVLARKIVDEFLRPSGIG